MPCETRTSVVGGTVETQCWATRNHMFTIVGDSSRARLFLFRSRHAATHARERELSHDINASMCIYAYEPWRCRTQTIARWPAVARRDRATSRSIGGLFVWRTLFTSLPQFVRLLISCCAHYYGYLGGSVRVNLEEPLAAGCGWLRFPLWRISLPTICSGKRSVPSSAASSSSSTSRFDDGKGR